MNKLIELREIMIEHQKADQLIQGSWWNNAEQTGCFYGCAMHTDENPIKKAIRKFKIEPWVAYWSEKVFEGLPQKSALKWPVELLDAMIAFDGDYTDVYHKLSIKRLKRLYPTEDQKVNEAIKQVIDYHKAPSEKKRKAANLAANSAVRSAHSASFSAAESAARSAADSATSAATSTVFSTATSAAYSARSADSAYSAAIEKHWEKERKWMLKLLGVSDE